MATIPIAAYAIASTVPLRELVPLFDGKAALTKASKTALVASYSGNGWAVLHDFGAVVFFVVDEAEQKRVIEAMQRFDEGGPAGEVPAHPSRRAFASRSALTSRVPTRASMVRSFASSALPWSRSWPSSSGNRWPWSTTRRTSTASRRDIYYRNDVLGFDPADVMTSNPSSSNYHWDYSSALITEVDQKRYADLSTRLRSPASYAERFREYTREQEVAFGRLLEFELKDDEYLMFGDNSPASNDSRLFDFYSRPVRGVSGNRYAVKESDLIGEALCIFWPHGVPFLNGGRGFAIMNHGGDKTYPLYSFPFYPNISRMKLIR